MTPLLVLVGPPGAGKTTIGRKVAAALDVEFRDTDDDVERTAGRTVADIFVEDGEPEFRRLEADAVGRALESFDGVLALGGGAVLDDNTRRCLQGHRVVLLDVGAADAAERVGFNRSRPLLVVNPRAELKRLLSERAALYAEVATAVVGTDGRSVDAVTADVLALVKQ